MSFIAPAIASIKAAGTLGTLSAIGTGLSALGTIQQASAASASANYQATVAQRNALLAEENAKKAVENSRREGQDYGEAARGEIAEMEARLAASGLSLNTGSTFLRARALRQQSLRDQGRIAESGTNRAAAFRQESNDQQVAAAGARAEAKTAKTAGVFSLASTLIGGAKSVKKLSLGITT